MRLGLVEIERHVSPGYDLLQHVLRLVQERLDGGKVREYTIHVLEEGINSSNS